MPEVALGERPCYCEPMEKTHEKIISQPIVVADEPRGVIEKLVEGNFQSVLRITSKAGSVRANHYHQRDSHICYLTYGKIEYYYRDAKDETATPEHITIEAGQLFYTPPMLAHAMHFLEDSEFYTFTTQPRGQSEYEEDTIRVKVFEPKA